MRLTKSYLDSFPAKTPSKFYRYIGNDRVHREVEYCNCVTLRARLA